MTSSPITTAAITDDRLDTPDTDRTRRLEVAVARAIAELELLVAPTGHGPRTDAVPPPGPLPERLAGRRRQVAEMALRGLPTTAIADHLGLSPNTVRNHLKAACRCLGVRSRTELIAQYRV